MNSNIFRSIGILLLVAAVIAAVLNLHRVADLRMPWLAPFLLVVGIAFVIFARRGKR